MRTRSIVTVAAGALLAASLTGAAAARGRPASSGADGAEHTITYRSIVDLSHVIDTDIPLWPGDPAVELTPVANFADDGYYLRSFTIGEHSGTHMNAPNSFHEGGASIDQYPAQSLVAPVVVIDVREQAAGDADYALTRGDVEAWERTNGRVPEGSVVVMFTGWQDRWGDPAAFFGEDADGGLHFPGFDGDTTTWLLDERNIAGVGIDTHGVDPGPGRGVPHQHRRARRRRHRPREPHQPRPAPAHRSDDRHRHPPPRRRLRQPGRRPRLRPLSRAGYRAAHPDSEL